MHVPDATAASSSTAGIGEEFIIHLWGLPWELAGDAVSGELQPLLPDGCRLLNPPLLPLDKRGRPTGRALIVLAGSSPSTLVDILNGFPVGSRFLEARVSGMDEVQRVQRSNESILAKMRERAPQHAFSSVDTSERAAEETLDAARVPRDARDFVLLCHETRADVASGSFDLNNLPSGRVDVLARCVSAALFVSHGVRRNVRVWLMLCDARLTLCLESSDARGLHPDERSIAAALRRALRAATSIKPRCEPRGAEQGPATPPAATGTPQAAAGALSATDGALPPGWSVHHDDTVEERLEAILGTGGHGFIISHELGAPLTPKGLRHACCATPTSLLVLGDHVGFRREEEACFAKMGGVRASVSPVPLLASHCIVLAHAVLDQAQLQQCSTASELLD